MTSLTCAATTAYAAPRLSGRGLALVVALHVAAFATLARLDPALPPTPLPVLSVSLLPASTAAPTAHPAAPVPPPAEPRPRPKPAAAPAPLAPLASIANAPAPLPAAPTPVPVPPPTPAAIPAPAPAPAATPAAPVAAAPAPAAPPAPPEPTPPRFDASYLDNPKPAYPALSRRLGEEGRVVLRVRVSPNGRAAEVTLAASSGSPRLDQAALDTVRRWRFVPARQGTDAVTASVLVPLVFSLKD